ncbi:uncharacterized protein LOC18448772 isoform X2 [Amborella trichopoda]|uniref:uncharacterized protein LOC18448772 isoform X2 n=1 Tax=Amborella trichopoda TaxID=13333 RepID=UPI0009BC8CBD|nr:uncharacterized protein LOC18448772 isoform X2 [Amborella trichopoda]|eukprot:XP_020532003.1 uncharacterized protein LOC18448772 isoform X2 [Amborella trichopoda]
MDNDQVELALQAFENSIFRVQWRLRAASKRRLILDVLALCTGLRPVVMVDYGGKVPELQERLCSVLNLVHKESSFFLPLRVMIIEEMVYLVHIEGFSQHVLSSLSLQWQLQFVDLDQDPPKKEDHVCVFVHEMQLIPKNKVAFSSEGTNNLFMGATPSRDVLVPSQPSQCIDLSSCLENSKVVIPTLNGWLLGYPVVYLFSKEHTSHAVCNLSTRPLHIFKILVCRKGASARENSQEEELMSFTVPYELSTGGRNEAWAQEFLTHMLLKIAKCKNIWRHLRMEVIECSPQSIAL